MFDEDYIGFSATRELIEAEWDRREMEAEAMASGDWTEYIEIYGRPFIEVNPVKEVMEDDSELPF